MTASVDREQVPLLIAAYLPVEICVFYQVVPVKRDGSQLTLGMVDATDLAALDYVGKMLAFSQLTVHPEPLTFKEHQDLIAYYFGHPPSAEAIAAFQATIPRQGKPTPASELPHESSKAQAELSPPPPAATPASSAPAESDETALQLLNSMLRRALDEKADRLFIELNDNGTCRVRYRQKGLLRDLFKELSDSVRTKLIAHLKQMVGLDATSVGQPLSAETARTYRGEPLVLQLRVMPQQGREGAILNILHGEAAANHQSLGHARRIAEAAEQVEKIREAVEQMVERVQAAVGPIEQHPGQPQSEWQQLTSALEGLQVTFAKVDQLREAWMQLQSPSNSSQPRERASV
jgi:type II secretory ATPase GspE/PulE/Tfp pilus assembly ATPase PilB-like protein